MKKMIYDEVHKIHISRFPYNDFLFEYFDDEEVVLNTEAQQNTEHTVNSVKTSSVSLCLNFKLDFCTLCHAEIFRFDKSKHLNNYEN